MKTNKISVKEIRNKPVNPLIKQTKTIKFEHSMCKLTRINEYQILEHLKK